MRPNLFLGEYSITLNRGEGNSFGFRVKHFGSGTFKVVDITPGSPADINGNIDFGDTLVSVNDEAITENTHINMITNSIKESRNYLRLRLKSTPYLIGKILNFLSY